ncbi:hypothetical protein AAG906_029150 [Vitis piasezkii]
MDGWCMKDSLLGTQAKRIVFHAICECLSHHHNAVMLSEPFNVPETSVGQLWMADEYEKVLLLVTTILSIQAYAFDPFIVYYFSITSQAREPKCFAMTIEGSTILLISEVARLNSLKKYFEREYHCKSEIPANSRKGIPYVGGNRPSEDGTIPLNIIAEGTKLSVEDVEYLLMESLSVISFLNNLGLSNSHILTSNLT